MLLIVLSILRCFDKVGSYVYYGGGKLICLYAFFDGVFTCLQRASQVMAVLENEGLDHSDPQKN